MWVQQGWETGKETLECKRKRVLSARRHNLGENKCMEVGLGGYHSGVQSPSPVAKYISTCSFYIYVHICIYMHVYTCTHTHILYLATNTC